MAIFGRSEEVLIKNDFGEKAKVKWSTEGKPSIQLSIANPPTERAVELGLKPYESWRFCKLDVEDAVEIRDALTKAIEQAVELHKVEAAKGEC